MATSQFSQIAIHPQQASTNPFVAYAAALRKFAVFEGRATRLEYWSFEIINAIPVLTLLAIDAERFLWVAVAILIATLLPRVGVTIRRLHDSGLSGWHYCWLFVPYIGGLIMLGLAIRDSQPGENKYGMNPKGL
jgi:uncharacterized membrane protein YhaH (DUF805 family)